MIWERGTENELEERETEERERVVVKDGQKLGRSPKNLKNGEGGIMGKERWPRVAE